MDGIQVRRAEMTALISLGKTDLPLTPNGIKRMQEAAKALVGEDRLVTSSTLAEIFVSPRQRAQKTLSILNLPSSIPVTVTDALAEWDYGDYEGVTTDDIKKSRESGTWDIWKDGCPGGEMPEDVEKRVDRLIKHVKEIHKNAIDEDTKGDVVLVAHGHILRSLTARWLDLPIGAGHHFLLDAGGVGVLWYFPCSRDSHSSYEHHSLDEPAVDCWNVTDGQPRVGPSLILRQRDWTCDLTTNSVYLLSIPNSCCQEVENSWESDYIPLTNCSHCEVRTPCQGNCPSNSISFCSHLAFFPSQVFICDLSAMGGAARQRMFLELTSIAQFNSMFDPILCIFQHFIFKLSPIHIFLPEILVQFQGMESSLTRTTCSVRSKSCDCITTQYYSSIIKNTVRT
jgi:sedoheptulose-bisphosphatase